MKVCKTCGEEKGEEDFWVCGRNRDRRRSSCKECMSAKAKATYRRYIKHDPEYKRKARVRAKRAYLRKLTTGLEGLPWKGYVYCMKKLGWRCPICGEDHPRDGKVHFVLYRDEPGSDPVGISCKACWAFMRRIGRSQARLWAAISWVTGATSPNQLGVADYLEEDGRPVVSPSLRGEVGE